MEKSDETVPRQARSHFQITVIPVIAAEQFVDIDDASILAGLLVLRGEERNQRVLHLEIRQHRTKPNSWWSVSVDYT